MTADRRRRVAATAAVGVLAAGVTVVTTALPAAAASVTFYRPADGVLHIAGHGYGHGHGMSQWGAYGGAESGQTYKQIVGWYYGNQAWGTASGTIKVQISSDGKGSDGRYDAQVKPVAGLTARDAAGHSVVLPVKNAAGTAYDRYRAVIASDGTFHVQAHAGTTWTDVPAAATTPPATPPAWTGWVRLTATGGVLDLVKSGGSTEWYRDTIELDKTTGTAGITVNRTSIEHYLAGVVPSEMPCSWTPTVGGSKRLDGLEAQAVAARSYAAWRRQHPRSSQVDIVDNTNDQAFHGYSAERTALTECPWKNANGTTTSASSAAVAATAGQVLVDANQKPIFAQYSASNGGFETAGSQAYLPSRPDAWDGVPTESWSSHSWSDSVTAGQIQAAYPSIGQFSALVVTDREGLSGVDQNGHRVGEQWGGRITGLTLTGTQGSVSTTGASFAAAMGLMGPWFTVVVHRPTAPNNVTATPGDAQATVHWSAPTSDGGGGIRSYTITATPSITPVTVAGTSRSVVVTGLTNDRGYVFSVTAANTAGAGPAAASPTTTPSARVVFHPLPPQRLLDTRSHGGAVGAGQTRTVQVSGLAGVPSSGVTDVVLDVVGIDPTAASNLSVYPHGGPKPADAQLSWTKGQRVNSLVWVKLGSGGRVDVTNRTGSTQLFIDVQGYYTQAQAGPGDVLSTVNSATLFDSRRSGPVPAGATRTFGVVGVAGVPTGATAAVVQVTAARPAQRDYVRVWGAGSTRPGAYDLYAPPTAYSSSIAVVPLTADGRMNISPLYATNLIVTLQGWFATSSTPSSGVTSLVTPTHRIARLSLAARSTTTVSLAIPAPVGGAVLNVVGTGAAGAPAWVWPAGQSMPRNAPVHVAPSPVTTSLVVPGGSGGKISVRNGAATSIQITVDVVGWSAA